MASRGTLLDLKKFRFGRNEPTPQQNTFPQQNYQNLAYYQQLHSKHANPISLSKKAQPIPFDLKTILPDFILQHPSFDRIKCLYGSRRIGQLIIPLKKARLKILQECISKREAFIFLWEAFPRCDANTIFITLDCYDWELERAIDYLNCHFEAPLKPLSETDLRNLLEESEDEWMEYDNSTERLARAEFDADEYNFMMDQHQFLPDINSLLLSSEQQILSTTTAPPKNQSINTNFDQRHYSYQQNNYNTNFPSTLNVQNNRSYINNAFNAFQQNTYRVPSLPSSVPSKMLTNNYYKTTLQPKLVTPQPLSSSFTPTNKATFQKDVLPTPSKYVKMSHDSQSFLDSAYMANASATNSNRTQSERDALIEFFNTATREELLTLKLCSAKKTEAIIQHRPFSTWDQITTTFERLKPLSIDLLQSAKKMLYLRRQIVKLLQQCEHISNDLQVRVDNMISQGQMLVKPSNPLPNVSDSQAPQLVLKPYQIAGINWLNLLFRMEMNGILADEMGLGKTVQVLAFIQYLLESGVQGPFLIIVPASTLENWTAEMAVWCPSSRLSVYYGSQSERKDQRYFFIEQQGIQKLDIILTTYAMVSSTTDDKNFFKRITFTYVIFDEAHMLKNMMSVRYKFFTKIKAKYRILLTGTPIQNNLMELMSLMQFILPDRLFEDRTEELKTVFSAYDFINVASSDTANDPKQSSKTSSSVLGQQGRTKSAFEQDRLEQAKRIVRPFVLRRTKASVLDQLPPKRHQLLLCDLDQGPAGQLTLYRQLCAQFKKEEEGQTNKGTQLPPMSILMQLRKAANHPLMLRNHYTDQLLEQMATAMLNEPTHKEANPALILEDMKVLTDYELYKLTKTFPSISSFKLPIEMIKGSGKLTELEKLMHDIIEKKEKALIFSQFTLMLDILQEYLAIFGQKFKRIDGSTPVPERLSLIKEFGVETDCNFFLLSTKAGGLGINLTAANHVIIYDMDINPYNDKQAEDRCHRVGQTKVVNVHRLVSKDTVEEIILQCNKEKLKLEQSMTGTTTTLDNNGMVLKSTDLFQGSGAGVQSSGEEGTEDIANLLKMAIS